MYHSGTPKTPIDFGINGSPVKIIGQGSLHLPRYSFEGDNSYLDSLLYLNVTYVLPINLERPIHFRVKRSKFKVTG